MSAFLQPHLGIAPRRSSAPSIRTALLAMVVIAVATMPALTVLALPFTDPSDGAYRIPLRQFAAYLDYPWVELSMQRRAASLCSVPSPEGLSPASSRAGTRR